MLNVFGSGKGALVRVIIFLLAWLNQYLVAKNLHPLPVFDEATVASVITFVVSAWTLLADNKVKKAPESK
ncbi:phage holin [Priestia sp. YIM B13551]|uniref:phage holin n=1 Tax=Priestia sp. YIM B13551 TaxID=3366306 RepID=UPI00366AC574